jgi:hypothetical protein
MENQELNELIIEKVWQLFPNDDYEEVMAVLDDYGNQAWHHSKEWVQLAALKMSNGKLERLRSSMKTAREDYRDILLVAREPNKFRVAMISEIRPPKEQEEFAEQHDKEQFESWLKSNDVKVCEECSGVGIVPEGEYTADATSSSGLRTPKWVKCSFCDGTGTQNFP